MQAAIWENERQDQQTGQIFKTYSCTLSKSYKDKNGNYVDMKIECFEEQLLIIAELAKSAYRSIQATKMAAAKKRKAERDANDQDRKTGFQPDDDGDIPPIGDDIPF